MEDRLNPLREKALSATASAYTPADVEKVRVAYLGRKGELTEILRSIPTLPADEKPVVGKLGNVLKRDLEAAVKNRLHELENTEQERQLEEFFDTTIPGTGRRCGSMHPIARIQREVEDIATSMGFLVVDGPEAESEHYNFEAVNIPKHHPARDTMDTFWLTDGNLLRTHTSSVQVRAMEKYGAPLKCIVPGRVFRYEVSDASHENTFFQVEGLLIDRDISVANFIAVIKELLSGIFKREVEVRLRPGYFPFVEPGFELDIQCQICGGKGCPVCGRSGWVELVPAGLVHPNVLRAGNVDPDEFSGFAFGLGLDRLVMMRYGIDDIRYFLAGDLRFLEQF